MSESDIEQSERPKRWRGDKYWPTPWPATRVDGYLCGVLVIASLVLACWRIWEGGFGWSDAPLHAMDGALVLDAALAWPRDNPVAWAEQYYAHFPCLGFVVYWPPGFAVLEAAIFAVFGLSVIAARAATALSFAATVVLSYAIGRRIAGRAGAVASAVLLLSAPFGLIWSRQVMLEWPAAMWVLLAVYAAVRFVDEPTWLTGLLAGVAVLGAYMTKQQAGHIALLLAVMPIVRPDRLAAVPWWRMYVPGAAAIGLIAYYHKTISPYSKLTAYLTAGEQAWLHLLNPKTWLYFVWRITEIVDPAMLVLCVVAGIALVFARRRGVFMLALLWLAAAYLACTIPVWKELRYGFWLLAPAAMLAGAGLVSALPGKAKYLALTAAVLVAGWQLKKDLSVPIYRLSDYSQAVAWLSQQGDADVVLIDGVREGQFIWDLRRDRQAAWQIVPLRGSKVLYSRAARKRWLYQEHVQNEQDISDLLSKYGIRYIVLESALPAGADPDQYDPPPRRLLRNLLATDERFDLAASWPIQGDPVWKDVELRIYRWDAPQRTESFIVIPIPAAGRTVKVDLPAPTTQPEAAAEEDR